MDGLVIKTSKGVKMANYDKNTIINKLRKSGLKPLYDKKTKNLYGFETSYRQKVGIKRLGYLDFLKVKLFKK